MPEDTVGQADYAGFDEPKATVKPKAFRFNPCSDAFHQDPYEAYRWLRRHAPYHRMLGSVVLTRYADIAGVLSSRAFSSKLFEDIIWRNKPNFGMPEPDPIQYFIRKAIVFTDNPDHARLRRLTKSAFTPRQIDSERQVVAAAVDTAIERAAGNDVVDVIASIADPVPLRVMAGRLGLDIDATPAFAQWITEVRQLLDPGLMTRDDYERTHDAMNRLLATVGAGAGRCPVRHEPAPKTLTDQLRDARWGHDQLNEQEIALLSIMTFVAGTETTKALIGNGLYLLLSHPEQLALLRRNRALLPNAIDEIMRFESPLQQTKRVAIETTRLGDVTIREGEHILLCLGAANRDPAQFDDPDRFDIRRANGNTHLAFGYGMRNCLGGALAATIAETVIDRLLLARTDVALAQNAALRWQTRSRILRSLEYLPVRMRMPT